MGKVNYNKTELKQILDIAQGVIEQLKHFSANFALQRNEIEIPVGMHDNEAELFQAQYSSVENVYNEMSNLSAEPFISWIKISENDTEKIILVTRNYTPKDYKPYNESNVFFASKLSPYASKALLTKINHSFTHNNKRIKILYRDRYFIPQLTPIDGIHNTIDLSSGTYSVESLIEILKGISDKDIILDIEQKIKNALEASKFRSGLRRRIIENIQLRDQPILDEYQIKVYRTPLASNLIITGSAGTGKTTVLINRISLATKPEHLSEDEKAGMIPQGWTLLNKEKENWILFTPTDLLKMYLKEAFNKEKIPAHERQIKVWHDERMDLGKNTIKFLRVGDSGIFVRTNKNIFNLKTSDEILHYMEEFQKYYLVFIEEKFIQAVNDLSNQEGFSSIPTAFKNIRAAYKLLKTDSLFEKIVTLIERLSKVRNEHADLKKNFDISLESITRKILREKPEILEKINTLLKDIIKEEKIEEFVKEDLSESEEAEFEQNMELSKDSEIKAYNQLNRSILYFAERKIKKQPIVEKSINGKVISLIRETLTTNEEKIISLGNQRITLKQSNQLTLGYIRNLIQAIPNYYLRYRNSILENSKQSYFNSAFLKEIKEKKLLSDIEIDILLYVILANCNIYLRKNPLYLTSNSGNDLLENIKSSFKNLVTVDESTDFSAVTLGCMYYLAHPSIKSFTLTGDLMQRVTDTGIQKWEECNLFLSKPILKNLTQVYRQSPKLLNIAYELYNNKVGEPPFTSAFETDEQDPEPLKYKSKDNIDLGNWITSRILEIYKISESKASIALFVSDDTHIDSLYEIINEPLSYHNIEVDKCKEGRILSTEAKIRIFSVEYIKGLEFEAVFFIDIDEIYSKKPNLVDKYLYVGLTRAGSFLAITYKHKFPKSLKFIEGYFKEGDWSWLTK